MSKLKLGAVSVAVVLVATGAWWGVRRNQPKKSEHYTGSATCRNCHENFYKLWATSHHGLAMQPFTPEFARSALTPATGEIQIDKQRYRAEISGRSGWVYERGPEGEKKYLIDQVMGGKNVYYFLTPLERGRLQVLPVAYDVRSKTWFDTAASGMRHFTSLPEQRVAWRDQAYTFNTSCFNCHVSQLATNYDLASDTYHTVWAEPGINCETCHGPAGKHVQTFRDAAKGVPPQNLNIIVVKQFNHDEKNSLCGPCHAKMQAITATFKLGDRYFDHFRLEALEDPDFYPDGRDLGENYTYTSWLMSPCAKSGQLDCVYCHTSSGRFRFAAEPNQACLACHQDRVQNVEAHTHHPAGSEGSKCISCHMPKTSFARMQRSDHSMRPPTPATTLAFKSPNACNLCHTDHDAAWADKLVRHWHKVDYQAPVLREARLIDAARRRDWSSLPDMLKYISAKDHAPVFAASLIRLLEWSENDAKWPVLRQALKDPSPLVRSAAAAGLGANLDPQNRDALLEATADDYRLVRIEAARALAAYPRDLLALADRQRLEHASREFEVSLKSRPDDYLSYYNLGNYYASRGDSQSAMAAYETSMKLEPRSPLPLVNASLVYAKRGDGAKAEDVLRKALEIDPSSAAANYNLGLLLAEKGNRKEAEQCLRAALKIEPEMAQAAYNLGVLLADDRLDEALDYCREAHNQRPNDPKYAYTLAFYQAKKGDLSGATQTLRLLLKQPQADIAAYKLLGEIYEQQGKRAEAIAVYRLAAANANISPSDRAQFSARMRAISSP